MTSNLKCFLLIFIIVVPASVGVYWMARSVDIPVGYIAIIQDPVSGDIWTEGNGLQHETKFGHLFLMPFASYDLVYVATDRVDMWGTGDEDLPDEAAESYHYSAVQTLSSDGLSIEVDVTVRWRLNADKVLGLFQLYPMKNWRQGIIIPTIRQVCRDVLTQFDGMAVISNRSAIDATIAIEMEEAFRTLPSISDAVIYDQLNMRNIKLPTTFTTAIEQKAAAEQLAVAAVFTALQITTLAQANADALVIAALAQANATVLQAQASAQAVVIQADSIGTAVEMLMNATGAGPGNATLYAQMYLWIQALQVIANSTGDTTYFIVIGEGMIPYVYPINPQGP
jgi:regulator of protease activity HflC (stomatin/prohibitin superfamily)